MQSVKKAVFIKLLNKFLAHGAPFFTICRAETVLCVRNYVLFPCVVCFLKVSAAGKKGIGWIKISKRPAGWAVQVVLQVTMAVESTLCKLVAVGWIYLVHHCCTCLCWYVQKKLFLISEPKIIKTTTIKLVCNPIGIQMPYLGIQIMQQGPKTS